MIIAVDFDGTLAITDYPTIVRPKYEVIDYCNYRKTCGDTLILWTCRHGKELEDAVEWCKKQGLVFDYINESSPDQVVKYGESRKVYADIYLDDHNKLVSDFKD